MNGSAHTAFAERYLALALTATAALWTSAILAHGPRWSLKATATLAASFVLVGLLSATGIVGLPLFQPRVEKAFASAFADGATGLGGESTLGEFASLAVSRRRVLDLETSLASGGAWRLPSEVFTAFDGRRWFHPDADPTASRRSTTVQPMKAAPATSPLVEGLGGWFATGAAPGPGSVEMRVTQAEVTDWPLFAPRGTRAVTATAYLLEIDPDGLVRRPPGDALRLYGMLWSPVAAGADAALSADERAASLALPAVDPRTEALARRLANGTAGSDVRSRIDATVRHLQTGYRYTLAPGRFRTNDPLAEFLFEKKAAYCEYFATAAVVLLRLQGVPARYVKGLAVGPNTDQGGGLHVVRESDAHAWVEAFIPGEGWVEEDPTPPGDFRAAHAPASLLAQLVQRTRAALAQAWARLSARGPAAFLQWLGRRVAEAAARLLREPLAWLALVLALAARPVLRLVRGWLRQRARVAPDAAELAVPDDLRALVRALERRWAQAGRPRPAGRGLLEHARRLASGPEPLVASLGEAGTRIVEAYYRVRFGGDRASAAETSVLQERLLADGYNDGWVSR